MNDMNKTNDNKQKDAEKSFLQEEKVFQAISRLDDDLIEEARPRPARIKRPSPKKWLAVAAAVLAIAIIFPYIMDFSGAIDRKSVV